MDNLDAVLKAHGTSLEHTVKFTIFVRSFLLSRSFFFFTDHVFDMLKFDMLKTIDHVVRHIRRA